MFGIFDDKVETVENTLDVGISLMTFGEYGDLSKETVSKLIADGIELAVISSMFGVSEDIIKELLDS